jgi:ataxia telangiectasia mutated family protein
MIFGSTSRYRYNKGDIPPHEFSAKMSKMREENRVFPGLASKLITHFLSLRERFKPVMRHFFTEKHKVPMSWFAMRLNYTRSVATTSIVGHILGLGDRHTSNILLDSSTGEVVHIDLGIAFEQVASPRVLSLLHFHTSCRTRENFYQSRSAFRSA